MKDQKISMRQMMTLLLIALVSLGAEVVPGIAQAGAAAWLAPLMALIPVLILLHFAFRGPEQSLRRDLGEDLPLVLGKWGGKVAAALFLLWALFLLVVNAARCARRLTVAGGTPVFFSAIVLGLTVWMAAKKLPAFARACEIFYLAMGAGIVGITLLAGVRLQPEYSILFTNGELLELPRVALSVLGVASIGLYGLFLAGDVTVRKGDGIRCRRWAVTLFVILALLLLLILGTFGAPLVAIMQRPFFQMVAGLGLTGAFQRLEALVSALWMLGDVALLGLLLFGVRRLTEHISGRRQKPWSVVVAGLLAFLGGELLAGKEGLLRISQQVMMPMGSLVAGLILTLLFFLVRHKKKGGAPQEEWPSN